MILRIEMPFLNNRGEAVATIKETGERVHGIVHVVHRFSCETGKEEETVTITFKNSPLTPIVSDKGDPLAAIEIQLTDDDAARKALGES